MHYEHTESTYDKYLKQQEFDKKVSKLMNVIGIPAALASLWVIRELVVNGLLK